MESLETLLNGIPPRTTVTFEGESMVFCGWHWHTFSNDTNRWAIVALETQVSGETVSVQRAALNAVWNPYTSELRLMG